jgi:hypothetical protein
MCGFEVGDVVCSAVGAWLYVVCDWWIVGGEGFAAEVAEVGVVSDLLGGFEVAAGSRLLFGMEGAAVGACVRGGRWVRVASWKIRHGTYSIPSALKRMPRSRACSGS